MSGFVNTGWLASPSSGSALGVGIIPAGAVAPAAPALAPAAGGGVVGIVGLVGVVFVVPVVGIVGIVGIVGTVGIVGVVGIVVMVGTEPMRPALPLDALAELAPLPATLARPAAFAVLDGGCALAPAEPVVFERAVLPAFEEASPPEQAAISQAQPMIHAWVRVRAMLASLMI